TGNVDALIVLTEKQKNDIVNRFGHEDKVFVIPKYYEVNVPKIRGVRSLVANVMHYSGQNERDMSKVSIVSTVVSVKNIDPTINARESVGSEVSEARLEVWGLRHKKEEYRKMIESIDLGKNAVIKCYTQNPETIYQDPSLSVVTPNAEGFSLS